MFGYQWWNPRQEPELRSLCAWLDSTMTDHHHGRETGLILGVCGAIVGVAAGCSALIGAFDPRAIPYELRSSSLMVIWLWAMLSMAAAAFLIRRRRSPLQREAMRAFANSRNFVWQLISARHRGNLRNTLGEARALALNDGAGAYLRAKAALEHPAWKAVAPDAEFAATRERTKIAIEVAMARLVTIIGQGMEGNAREVVQLVNDMAETADEATRAAERLSRDSGQPGDASENLRQVLAEMRLLNSAHDELDKLRDRAS